MSKELFVWVIAHDGGCEGWSGPMQAASTEAEARALLAVIRSGGESFGLFKVPLWPNVQLQPWYRIEEEARQVST